MRITRRNLVTATAAGTLATSAVGSRGVWAQDGVTISVGSKNYTEQLINGELLAQMLEAAGYSAERNLNLGGTLVAHEAIVAGDIDTYVEFTGTSLIAILGMEVPEAPEEEASPEATASATPAVGGGARAQMTYDIVAEIYPEEFGVEYLDPLGYNNTYAIAMRREHAEELGVTKISDLQQYSGELSIGSDAEGIVREDGVAGLKDAYGIEFSDEVTLDAGLMYSAVAEGEVDTITAFSTDGRIPALDLVLLEDDLEFFPPYYAAPIVRIDALEENEGLRETLNQLAGKISTEKMTEMNYMADGEGMDHAEIVRNFLIEQGIVEG